MVIDNIKNLLFGIFIVALLLCVCVHFDYADDTIVAENESLKFPSNVTVVNKSAEKVDVIKHDGKLHIDKSVKEKPKKKKRLPTISMWAKPSVRCGYPYKWYYRTFVDYCPNCKHYNCLLKNPKGVPENEYTCAICDSDFDGVVGKEKYSWSNVYLRRA